MSSGHPLLFGWQLDGQGGGRPVSWADVLMSPLAELSPCWLHLNRHSEAAVQWLIKRSGLDPFASEAMMALETRPRCLRRGNGIILYLRAANFNEGADPQDMLTARLWVDDHGIISLRRRRMLTPEDIHFGLQQGDGPTTPGDLLVDFIERLTERMEPVLETMRNRLEKLETSTLADASYSQRHRQEGNQVRSQLGQLRVRAIGMRRYLGPQRDALVRLAADSPPWLSDDHRTRLREMANETTRYLEDLDEIRDTAGIIQDQVAGVQSDATNTILYQLTLVTVFFMPLSFLVGYFGSNTGGMFWGGDPADSAAMGATYEFLLLVAVSVIEIALFRIIRWI